MSDDERLAIRRYYFSADEVEDMASLPAEQQAEIDARLAGTFGAAAVRTHLALASLWREIKGALPGWLRRLMR